MRYFTCLLILLLCAAAANAQQANPQIDNTRMSPKLMRWLKTPLAQQKNLHGIIHSRINDTECLSALIKVNDHVDEAGIKKLGAYIGTKAGNIWTVRIPVQQMQNFIRLSGIDFIELDRPLVKQMDSARYATHVDSVQKGINIPMPLTGKGVVVGIIDEGFDYTNPAFYDTTYSHLRIKRIWDQTGSGAAPQPYGYGIEYTDTSAMLLKGTDIATDFHATHVSGIAAGSGYGSPQNNEYRGIAYESDLVFVTNPKNVAEWRSMTISSVIDGLDYIFRYAQSVGKPAVVNLSEGSELGPHDGTSLFSQAVDALTGAGKIFVVAAGNDAETNHHFKKEFTGTDTIIKTFVAGTFISVDTLSPTVIDTVRKNNIEIWGDTTNTFCFQLSLYRDSTEISSTSFYCPDDTYQSPYIIGSDNDTCFIYIEMMTRQVDGRRYADIEFHNNSSDTVCLTVKGTNGLIHAWQEFFDSTWVAYSGNFTNKGISWATDGDNQYSMGEVACTKSVITVGAYVSRKYWIPFFDPNTTYFYGDHTAGDITPFSCHGPTVDGRMKPDITAPGSMVASSVSSFCPDFSPGGYWADYTVDKYHSSRNRRDYYYAVLEGTSMASPMVTGIVALMLQADSSLTPDTVKKVLYQTAIKDNFTTPHPDSAIWGAGKINAYSAVRGVILNLGVNNFPLNRTSFDLYPNPGSGSFILKYEAKASGLLYVEITNSLGQVMSGQPWRVTTGNNMLPLEMTKAKQGIYFVTIYSSGNQVTKRMVVF